MPRLWQSDLSARLATFSYAKATDYYPFHASWAEALCRLQAARRWILIGYSLPEADFAFKELLKSAQMGSPLKKEILVVTKEDQPGAITSRYSRFFGTAVKGRIYRLGIEAWVDESIGR